MSYRERQMMEFEVVESIFGADVEDLRPKQDHGGWKPLNLRIKLTPLQGSYGPAEIYVRISLRIICSSKYPKVPPKVSLEHGKGLSDALTQELEKQLTLQTEELRGQEMIYELAQTVQGFLHKYNKPPSGSFYEEMLQQRNQRDQERMNCQKMRESLEQKAIKDEIEKRKEILKNESRIRRDTRSLSESSPQHGNSMSMDASHEMSPGWPYFRSHMYPNECLEHRHSERIFFTQAGRQIQRGCCLGHSQKGCVAYSGIDLETGQLMYITEWMIKYDELDRMCQANCLGVKNGSGDGRCSLHYVDDVISYIEKQVNFLSQLRHKNLINYECCLCLRKKDGILVYLVQDFVLGTSVYSISGTLGWCVEGAGMVAKGVLDAIIYLHNNSVFHNQLIDTTVFMDNTGTIRVTDFSLVPHLQELIGGPKANKSDLPALGALIEALLPTHPNDMRDYIDRCKSDRTLTAVELQSHPFLQSNLYQSQVSQAAEKHVEAKIDSLAIADTTRESNRSMVPVQSRLENEFEFIQFLGRGAYGDVLKVRNILDNRQYAIKRIPLTARNKQLYKKIRREVELLSRLNHENVVRYYNSWIEVGLPNTDFGQAEMDTGEFSMSLESRKDGGTVDEESSSDEDSSDWINCIPPAAASDSDSDDGIEFVNSDGECAIYVENPEEATEKSIKRQRSPRADNQFMYIQMEFCEKSTLRTAIDSGLHADKERLWRLFREIAEGLAHIHQQGMIHRDLKPVNIFLDSRDQVKIGDFGLATTSFLALQNQEQHNLSSHISQTDLADTLTGHVGTALYVAPELTGNASKSAYNNKVDLYSLGIILFEMFMPPFGTGMERVTTMHALRTPEIIFPGEVLRDSSLSKTVKVIAWLLDHDPSKRPTSEELLASDLIPPPRLEATELQEMLRNVLANPQSKTYKHLVSRCLSQHNDEILELTYHMGVSIHSACLEYVKNKVVDLLRLHGAVEVTTPLLTPLEVSHSHHNSVKLMTHSGCVVYLPYDFRVPLARQVALNGITAMRRYSIGRVYREKKVFNFHPKMLYECAFDIINQGPGNLLADAEVLAIAFRITNEFPVVREKNPTLRLNHTSLLKAILIHCNVAKDKYVALFQVLGEFMDSRISKFQLTSAIHGLLTNSATKSNTSTLIELLLTESPLGVKKNNVTGNSLRSLLRGRGEAAALANGAFREMEHVVALAQQMGVTCPILLHAGISVLFDRTRSGVVWQLVADLKIGKKRGSDIMAVGGRYDDLLSGLQKTAANSGAISVSEKNICGVGFSFALDKLVYAIGPNWGGTEYRAIEILLCVTGSRPPIHTVTEIMRLLWSLKIRCGVLEANNLHEAESSARDLGANHMIVLEEDGALRVSSFDNRIFNYHKMTRSELNEHLQRLKTNDLSGNENSSALANSGASYSTYASGYPYGGIAAPANTAQNYGNKGAAQNIEVVFTVNEKLVSHQRKRLQNQIVQQMSGTLNLFNKSERIKVYALEITTQALAALVGALDLREIAKADSHVCDEELGRIIERFPRLKKVLLSVYDDIVDDVRTTTNGQSWSAIGLYSISDNVYRMII